MFIARTMWIHVLYTNKNSNAERVTWPNRQLKKYTQTHEGKYTGIIQYIMLEDFLQYVKIHLKFLLFLIEEI